MIKNNFIFLLIFFSQIIFSQSENSIYKLNPINDLLTPEVKKVIDSNLGNKETVFLGEAVHYSGSDLLSKTEFVKYLVIEHDYKDIAFESDFFALLFDHKKENLYSFWSISNQCEDLFDFLKKNGVTIWGFDNQIHSDYSYYNFSKKLAEILNKNGIVLNKEFTRLSKLLIKHQYNSSTQVLKEEFEFLKNYLVELQSYDVIKTDKTWTQILKSFESSLKLYSIKDNSSDKKRIPIRDKQMAKNLDFLIKSNPAKKFIVWLANAHMSKSNSKIMKGQTMGFQFRELNPNTSYHIATTSLRLHKRSDKDILKASKKSNNILSLLPSINHNYFIDAKKLTSENLELRTKMFHDMYLFNLPKQKTNLLNHFDALVFIANGEEVKYDN